METELGTQHKDTNQNQLIKSKSLIIDTTNTASLMGIDLLILTADRSTELIPNTDQGIETTTTEGQGMEDRTIDQ